VQSTRCGNGRKSRDAGSGHRTERQLPGVERPGPHPFFKLARLTLERRARGPVPAGQLWAAMRLLGGGGSDLHTTLREPLSAHISELLALQRAARISPRDVVTGRIDELDALRRTRRSPADLPQTRCTSLSGLCAHTS